MCTSVSRTQTLEINKPPPPVCMLVEVLCYIMHVTLVPGITCKSGAFTFENFCESTKDLYGALIFKKLYTFISGRCCIEHFVLQLLLIFFASDMGFRRLREDGIIPE